jgi:hypothetical protein
LIKEGSGLGREDALMRHKNMLKSVVSILMLLSMSSVVSIPVLTFGSATEEVFPPGDVNHDLSVNILDYLMVHRALGAVNTSVSWEYRHPGGCPHCPHPSSTDINSDGIVDLFDIVIVMENHGQGEYVGLPGLPATIYVDPETTTMVGANFAINVYIANVTNLYSYEFKLYYNTTILNLVSVVLPPGHFLEPVGPIGIAKLEGVDDYNATHGYVWAAVTRLHSQAPRNGGGVLATITFKAAAEGKSFLKIQDTVLGDFYVFPIRHNVYDGYVKAELLGDVNDDGIVDIVDGVIMGVAFGSRPGDPKWNPIADIVPDDIIDIQDIVLWATHFGKTAPS